jgi:WhiB family redox-sensing transcriptional regulator
MTDTRRLPVPVAENWDWQVRGACRGMESRFFFHPDGERGPARAIREARAKQICRSCQVLDQCRAHALTAQEPYGVWGGLSSDERQLILHDRIRAGRWLPTVSSPHHNPEVGAEP